MWIVFAGRSKITFNLNKKTVVIFGGGGTLGQQFSKACLEYGASVYSCDINDQFNEITQSLIEIFPDNFNVVKSIATLLTINIIFLLDMNHELPGSKSNFEFL